MKRNNKKGQGAGVKGRGFTLLELLVAVTIFSIIAVALYSTFYTGITALRRTEEAMKAHQDLRLVTEELALNLRNALLAPLYEDRQKKTTAEITEEEEEEPIYFFLGEEKRFTFVALKDGQICNITYFLKGGTPQKLMRTIRYQSRGFTAGEGEGESLLTDIEDMRVQYSYEGEDEDSLPEWLNFWEQEEKVPLGVKIKLKLKGVGALRELNKTVFIAVGVLGVEEESEI